MHTQNDIEILIRGSSDLSEDRRKKILQVLPSFYELIKESLLLDDGLKSRYLLLLPAYSDEQIEQITTLFTEGQSDMDEALKNLLGGDDTFVKELDEQMSSSKKILQKGQETLEHVNDELEIQKMEQEFTDDEA